MNKNFEDYLGRRRGPRTGDVPDSRRGERGKKQAEEIIRINNPEQIQSVNRGNYPNIDVDRVEEG